MDRTECLGAIEFQHSLDLTSHEFFVWNTVKEKFERPKPCNLDTLWEEIQVMCAGIPFGSTQNCIDVVSHHLEHSISPKYTYFPNWALALLVREL